MASSLPDTELLTTPLDGLHRRLGGRMVAFAGYSMPVQYPLGVMGEHLHCRAQAALFDVSHMGQASLVGEGAAEALEALVPGDMKALKPMRQRYTLLMADDGGIIDDLMVANYGTELRIVVNASRKAVDYAHLRARLPAGVSLVLHEDRALLALQGPAAATVLGRLAPEAAAMPFMGVAEMQIAGSACWISRSGYTGEDGYEISVPAAEAEAFAERLLAEPEVQAAGLGARDSLRLEAGLCLYGNDIDLGTDPVSAGLVWTIGKRRRTEWNFAGAEAVRAKLDGGTATLRVGLRPDGKAPARAGTEILAEDGTVVGSITSGGFGPSLGAPLAMGYVRRDLAADGAKLLLNVRGKHLPATVVATPFVPHRYVR